MPEATVAAVVEAIRAYEFHYSDEDQLQEGLAEALTLQGFDVRREVRLNVHDRVDLMVGRIGIEVKVAGPAGAVGRQCARYLKSSELDELILVSNRPRHSLGVGGLPVEVVTLLSPW